jgi:chromosome partitioning related protein ParA
VSRTAIEGLDLVLSNDDRGELNTLLLHAPDGACGCATCCPLAPHYDLLLIDTQGAQRAAGDGGAGLDLALSPVTPEILAARELRRGAATHRGHRAVPHLGIEPPPLHLLINRVHPVSSNARLIQQALRQVFQEQPACACWTPTCRPSKPIRAPRRADCRCIGWNTASRRAHGTRRAGDHARWPASCSRRGRSALRWSPAEADAGGAGHGERT